MPPLTNDLVGQFVLCKSEEHIPENWNVYGNGTWILASHPALPVIELLSSDHRPLGWLLGYPIGMDGHLVTESLKLPVSSQSDDADCQFEAKLYEHGGRFAAVFLTRNASRFYLDPCGSLAAVFCPEQQIIASSIALIPYSGSRDDNTSLIDALRIPHEDKWYPFGLTPRYSVDRLMPNHYLDLTKWEPVRHWPVGEITMTQDTRHAVSEMASIAERHVTAIVERYPVYMSLTAGTDTRILLACSKNLLDKIILFTMQIPDEQARQDCEVARRISKQQGLNHIILRHKEPTKTELDQWLYRTGHCVAGRTWRNVRTLRQLDPQRVVLEGNPGNFLMIGRRWTTIAESNPIAYALQRRNFPRHADIENRARQWLESLPIKNGFTILELFLVEQRFGCWMGPSFYGHVNHRFWLGPFCHRRAVETMMSLPREKRGRYLAADLISSRWPELLQWPFNEPISLRGKVRKHAIRMPRKYAWILKRIGKLSLVKWMSLV